MEESNSQNKSESEDIDAAKDLKTQKSFSKIAFATTGLFVLAIIYTLYFGRELLLPIIIAILLNFLLAPVIRALNKIHIPHLLGALLILIIFYTLVAGGVYRLSGPINAWVSEAPTNFSQATSKLNQITAPIGQYFQRLFNIQEQIEKTTSMATPKKNVQEVTLQGNNWSGAIFSGTWEFFIQLGTVTIVLFFFLASKEFILTKLIKVLPFYSDKKEAIIIMREIEKKISYFLLMKIIVGAGLAVVMGLALLAIGMPHPFIWGILAGILEFIPYVGVLIGTIAITFSALLTFDSLGHMLLAPSIFFIICAIEGNIVLPLVLNRGLILHPLIILLAFFVFGWLWSITGAIIAIPIVSIFKIICDNLEPLNAYGKFLGVE